MHAARLRDDSLIRGILTIGYDRYNLPNKIYGRDIQQSRTKFNFWDSRFQDGPLHRLDVGLYQPADGKPVQIPNCNEECPLIK